jgi:hypothetical protein
MRRRLILFSVVAFCISGALLYWGLRDRFGAAKDVKDSAVPKYRSLGKSLLSGDPDETIHVNGGLDGAIAWQDPSWYYSNRQVPIKRRDILHRIDKAEKMRLGLWDRYGHNPDFQKAREKELQIEQALPMLRRGMTVPEVVELLGTPTQARIFHPNKTNGLPGIWLTVPWEGQHSFPYVFIYSPKGNISFDTFDAHRNLYIFLDKTGSVSDYMWHFPTMRLASMRRPPSKP